MEPSAGRRATDNISAAVALAIDEAAAETRHTLRTEITVFATQLEAFRLQSTQEHTEVKGHVMDLLNDMTELKALAPTVADIKQRVGTDAAVASALEKQQQTMDRNRVALRNYALGLGSLIVAAVGTIAGLVATAPH